MEERERLIRLWFDMWLQKRDLGIDRIFTGDAVYMESWGPEYHGADKIVHWFREWNSRRTVLVWDIRQFVHQGDQTLVEWYFENRADDGAGAPEAFDGITQVRWAPDGRIRFLKEYGCNVDRYDPYAHGPEPVFRGEGAGWF